MDGFLVKQLEDIEVRLEGINNKLQDPQVTQDQNQYRTLMKSYAELNPVVSKFREYKKSKTQLSESKELIESETDEDLKQMAKEELHELTSKCELLEAELKILLLPKDPLDDKNILLEIRAGAGGDEASLFADELFRAYSYYATSRGWRVEVLSLSTGNVGGLKEVVASITGEKVYSLLKYESGVHRVQRVPKTESQGRVHTSTITVAVLPEAEEVDVQVSPNDLRIDVFRSGGSGGQSVNTTDSAVRITHIPSGLVVICQDEKSQLKNKNKALKILTSRLLNLKIEEAQKDASEARLSQIGTGDRSERIRTYNFPQTRITDHRIGLTLHQLSDVMEGRLDLLIDPLTTYFQTEALKAQNQPS